MEIIRFQVNDLIINFKKFISSLVVNYFVLNVNLLIWFKKLILTFSNLIAFISHFFEIHLRKTSVDNLSTANAIDLWLSPKISELL